MVGRKSLPKEFGVRLPNYLSPGSTGPRLDHRVKPIDLKPGTWERKGRTRETPTL